MSLVSQYKTLTQLVVENLRNKIITNKIKAGERINLDALAEEFSVSKNPIREALFLLKGEGLIIFETNKGARVSIFDSKEIEELFSLKALLATNLLAESLPHISFNKLDEAKVLLTHLNLATSVNQWTSLNGQYYQCLYSGIERPQTIEVLSALATKTARFNHLIFVKTDDRSQIHASLALLTDYCSERKVELAKAHLQQHIMSFKRKVKILYEK